MSVSWFWLISRMTGGVVNIQIIIRQSEFINRCIILTGSLICIGNINIVTITLWSITSSHSLIVIYWDIKLFILIFFLELHHLMITLFLIEYINIFAINSRLPRLIIV